MAKNQTYKREIIDGKEVMVLVNEEVIPDEILPTPTIEELQLTVQVLQEQLTEVQQQIETLNNG